MNCKFKKSLFVAPYCFAFTYKCMYIMYVWWRSISDQYMHCSVLFFCKSLGMTLYLILTASKLFVYLFVSSVPLLIGRVINKQMHIVSTDCNTCMWFVRSSVRLSFYLLSFVLICDRHYVSTIRFSTLYKSCIDRK